MRNTILFISTILLLFFSCRKHDVLVNPQQEYEGIIPLALGNSWNIAAFLYDSTGAVAYSSTHSYEVLGDSMINGSKWYNVSTFLCANRSDGFLSLAKYGQLLLLKYPAAVQDSFYVNSVVGSLTVTSVDTQITTSLGTFHCYTYESHHPVPNTSPPARWRHIIFVAPHIGPIKLDTYATPLTEQHEYHIQSMELIAYNIV